MESHLLQMRGLKLKEVKNLIIDNVASFTDAWIETKLLYSNTNAPSVASFTDAWIETGYRERYGKANKSHLLQMRGLKP